VSKKKYWNENFPSKLTQTETLPEPIVHRLYHFGKLDTNMLMVKSYRHG
jgi:hypothetical protein